MATPVKKMPQYVTGAGRGGVAPAKAPAKKTSGVKATGRTYSSIVAKNRAKAGTDPTKFLKGKNIDMAKARASGGGGIDLPKFAGEVYSNVNNALNKAIPGRKASQPYLQGAIQTGTMKNNPLKKILGGK